MLPHLVNLVGIFDVFGRLAHMVWRPPNPDLLYVDVPNRIDVRIGEMKNLRCAHNGVETLFNRVDEGFINRRSRSRYRSLKCLYCGGYVLSVYPDDPRHPPVSHRG